MAPEEQPTLGGADGDLREERRSDPVDGTADGAVTAGDGERRPRRRPGRFRRWVLRPVVWGLAAAVVLVFLLQLLVDTPWARGKARDLIVTQLSARLDRQVVIEEISFELLPLSVTVRGLVIGGPDGLDPPFLRIPFATADADLDALQRNQVHLRQLRVEDPLIYLEYYPDGGSNVLRFQKRERRRPRRFEVLIDRAEVSGAEFGLDHERVRISIAADAIQARFQGLGDFHLDGRLTAQGVVVELPNADRPLVASVAARGELQRGHVEIKSARITAPGTSALAEGSCDWVIGDRQNRKCFFTARGESRGSVLEELGYFADLRGGFGFEGSLAWRPGTAGWRSRVEADRLELWQRRLDGLEGTLVADRYGVRFNLDRVGYAGGELSGEVVYEHEEPGRPMTVDLDYRRLMLDTLLADQGIPTHGAASRIEGSAVYTFPVGESRRGRGRAEVALEADPDQPGLLLAGAFPLRIDGGVVRSESIALTSRSQSALAGGWYDLDRNAGVFEYEIASADVAELTPLLPLSEEDRREPPPWLPTAGNGRFTGTLYLTPGDAVTDVELELEEVVTPSLTARRAGGSLHLERGGIEALRLELGDGDRALQIRGRVPFDPADERGIELSFDAFDWPLSEIGPWLDFELPVDGPISGRLDLHVDAEASDGRLVATAAPAEVTLATATGGEPLRIPLEAFATRLEWDRDRVRFERLEARAPSGSLAGDGVYDWNRGELDLDLTSPGLELGRDPLRRFLPRDDLRGELSVQARIRGPLAVPRVELAVAADGIAVGSRRLEGGATRLDLQWQDGRVEVDGRLLDRVSVIGGGRLDRHRADLGFDLEGSDLAGLLELAFEEPPAEVDGDFQGRLEVAGDLGDFGDLDGGGLPAVELTLDPLHLELRDHRLASLEPVRLELRPEGVEVDVLYLGEEATGSEVFLAGELGYSATDPVDLHLQSTVDGAWLELFDLGFQLEGTFEVLGRLGGTLERPTLDGQGELRDARVPIGGDFPYDLEDLRGVLVFEPESVVIDRVTGRLAGGEVELTGRYDRAPTLDGDASYRLRATGSDLHLLYPEGWLLDGDAELTLRSTEDGHLASGVARLERIEYLQDIRFDFAELMGSFLRRQRLEVTPTDSLLSSVQLDVEVAAPGTLRVSNNVADVTGSAELVLRGNLAEPVLYGEIGVDPGGTMIYNSTDYRIERGRLIFTDPYELDPEVDLVATTRVRDFDVTLALSGTFDRLETRFSSEPPLPDLEVFRLLSTGDQTPRETDLTPRLAELDDDRSTSAATFLYGQAASVIGERVNNLFGFDKFRIDPLTGSGDNLSKARVTVGKRLSKDVFVTYSVDPASTEEQRLQLEWQVSPGFWVVLNQNGDNSYSADARWERSF